MFVCATLFCIYPTAWDSVTMRTWECTGAFQLSPEQGLLKPGQECPITVVFRPQEALVYQQLAYCRFGEEADKLESRCAVLLQALGIVFILRVALYEEQHNTSVLSFGSVAVGQSLGRYFDIFNPSPVPACFSLTRLSGGVPLFGSEFCCDITEGKVGPGESLRVTVTFSPAVVDAVSVEHLTLKCSGALSEPRLTLTGSCIGPEVSLSSTVVDFGCIEEGGSVEKTVELVNSSAAEAIYQWDIDCSGNGVFSILPASGTVLPHSRCTLKAVYRPTQPNAHRRKVACLVVHKVKETVCTLTIFFLCARHLNRKSTVVTHPLKVLFILCSYSLVWTLTKDSSFSISPSSSHLAPLKSTSFRVSYHPKQPNSLHGAQLECFVYCKVVLDTVLHSYDSKVLKVAKLERSFSLLPLWLLQERLDVDKQLQYPFWCLTVRVIGHSFQSGKEHFIPRCSLKPPQVVRHRHKQMSFKTLFFSFFQTSGFL
uniref:Si:ch1073-349o24.2 n=1 Tax=Salarias fasciatus TaxID=181472 RepID=A0A672IIX4_SALFA